MSTVLFQQIGLHENDNYEKILSALTDISREGENSTRGPIRCFWRLWSSSLNWSDGSLSESNTEVPAFNIRHLLPDSLERFYRYNGSLTTPPCFQTVSWTLFNDTIRVSRRQVKDRSHKLMLNIIMSVERLMCFCSSFYQLAALEDTLKTEHNKLLSRNFRAPQLLHNRNVLTSFQTVAAAGSMSNILSLTFSSYKTRMQVT